MLFGYHYQTAEKQIISVRTFLPNLVLIVHKTVQTNCFDHLTFQEINDKLEAERELQGVNQTEEVKKTKDEDTNNQNSNNFLSGSMIANLIVFVGFALFAVTVNYVIKAVSPEEDGT